MLSGMKNPTHLQAAYSSTSAQQHGLRVSSTIAIIFKRGNLNAYVLGNLVREVRKYGTHHGGITQFYLPPKHLSTNGMDHTCISLTGENP